MDICWITSSFLLDVDIPIVPKLQMKYDIDWIVLTTLRNRDDDRRLIEATGCQRYRLIEINGFVFHPKRLFVFENLIREIRDAKYNLYYFDYLGMPYFMPLVHHYLPKKKCVIAAHNVKTPKGARYFFLAKFYMMYVIKKFTCFQVFSQNQLELLRSLKPDANILYAPLCLKDYGKPSLQKQTEPITFLFFGNIVEYKRVDLLLQAVHILKEKGITGFRVKISGYCRPDKWSGTYSALCKDLDIIELDIRRIPNEVIPNLFECSHYFVMPYQDIAQSGAMTVALRYNIPIIASELDVFKEFMNGKDDGYFFTSGSAESLADTMLRAIKEHNDKYDLLRKNQAEKVKEKLSVDAILTSYEKYINRLCQH